MSAGLRPRRLVAILLAVLLNGYPALAQAQVTGSDAAAKAKLVTTLVRFVQWPPSSFETASTPLRLCVQTGSPTVEQAFQAQQGAVAGARILQISIIPPASPSGCHALYLDESAGQIPERWLRAHMGAVALTVGTNDGFVSDGGMVEIVRVDNALRFDVNLASLRNAGLTVNPGVLKLARNVKQ